MLSTMTKRLLPFIIGITFSLTTIAQNYHVSEDFNASSLPTGWTNNAASGTQAWSFGQDGASAHAGNNNLNGSSFAYFDDDALGGSATNNTAHLITPSFNNAGIPSTTVEFDYNFRQFNGITDKLSLEVFNGTTWVEVWSKTTDDCGNYLLAACQGNYPHAVVDISSHANATCQVRFVYFDGNDWGWYAGVDNVQVYSPFPNDIGVAEILGPLSGCGLGSTETVSVKIKNLGSVAATGFSASYTINGGAAVTENVVGTIQPGDSLTYNFTTTTNLSVVGAYTVQAYTNYTTDSNNGNDSSSTITTNEPLHTLTYSEGFESGPGGWTTRGANNSWALGTPNSQFMTGAAGGLNAWATNLTGPYNNNELSYLESPCFDFSGVAGSPILSFNLFRRTEANWDYVWLEASYNNGSTWNKVLAAPNATNWYNNGTRVAWDGNSGGWVSVETVLSGAGGQSQAKFRFVFDSDGSSSLDGIGIDNFSIRGPQQWDIETRALIQPVVGGNVACGFGSSQTVEIEVINKGANAITSFDAGYIYDGGAPVLQNNITPSSPIAPNTTYRHIFSTTVNMATPGNHSIQPWAKVANDSFTANDTLAIQTVSNGAVSLPNGVLDFEGEQTSTSGFSTLNNGWTQSNPGGTISWRVHSGGTSSFATGPTIDHTTGSAAGKYVYIETSTGTTSVPAIMESPCYNLGTSNGAILSFWYHKHGATMGDMFVDVFFNGIWINGIGVVRGQTHPNQLDDWLEKFVSLNQWAGNSLKIRFRGFRTTSFTGDMALDDILIYEPIPQDATPDSTISPESGCDLTPNELVCVRVHNFGTQDILKLTMGYQINGGPVVKDSVSGILIIPDAKYNFCFNLNRANLSAPGEYAFKIWSELAGDTNFQNDTLYDTIVNETRLFPDCEPFTIVRQGNGTGGGDLIDGKFSNNWVANRADFSWEISGPGNPGPNTDHTPTGQARYIVVDQANGNPGDVARLTSPCYDLTTVAVANLEFWYNMQNNNNNRLYIDVFDGFLWNNSIDSINGAQQAGWRLKRVSLANYTGAFVNVRFRGAKGGGYYALDDICVVPPPPNQAQMTNILRPRQDLCFYSSQERVRVRMKNIGSNDIDSLQVRLRVDYSNNPGFTNFLDTIVWAYPGATPPAWSPGKLYTYDIPVDVDMSVYSEYRIRAQLILSGDLDPTDDAINDYMVTHRNPVQFPYTEGFESLSCNATGPNYPNGFRRDERTYQWRVKCGPDRIGLTGPSKDHTRGNNFGRYFVTNASVGEQGDFASLETPCMDLSTLNKPVFRFYYHMFGFQMGELFIDINDDNGWVTVDSILGQQQINNGAAWLQRSIDLGQYAGSFVKMRFRSKRGSGGSSDMAIDDLFLYDLSKYDISPEVLVRPGKDVYSCYSDTQTVVVQLKNFGSQPLDFTVDSLYIQVNIDTNGVPYDTMFREVNSNIYYNQTFGIFQALPSDSIVFIKVDNSSDGNSFFDMSHLGVNYGFDITTYQNRDSITANDNLKDNVTTQIAGGNVTVDNNSICNGTLVRLNATNFFGAPKWERKYFSTAGNFWLPEFGFGSDSAEYISQPDTTTYYRIRVCDSDVVSDSVLVDVTVVKIPDPIHDTICGGGTMTVEGFADPVHNLQAVNWYINKDDTLPFKVTSTAPFTHTDFFSTTKSFWLEGVIDSCVSLGRSEVFAVVNPFPIVDLGLMNDTVCQDTNKVLNAGAGQGYVYNWRITGPNGLVDSSDLQTVGINAARLMRDSTYTYAVTVTSQFGCVTTSPTINVLITDSCFVGIAESSALSNRLEIYPNPTKDIVKIRVTDQSAMDAEIQIMSIDGRLIYREVDINLNQKDHKIDLGKLPNGLYYIKIRTEEGSLVKKLIKS